jgi:hypothetical protein
MTERHAAKGGAIAERQCQQSPDRETISREVRPTGPVRRGAENVLSFQGLLVKRRAILPGLA